MSFEVPPLSSVEQALAAQPGSRTDKPEATGPVADSAEVRVDTIPSTPPAELGPEMERAAKRVDELHAEGRELHFQFDEQAGRVQIQVRDLDGNVLRTIPPSKALAVASGEKLD